MGVTADLSAFTADLKIASLPKEVVTRARFLVLDLVGNIVRARHDAESTHAFLATVRAMGMANGDIGVFGDAARYTDILCQDAQALQPIHPAHVYRTTQPEAVLVNIKRGESVLLLS